jgi:hypothetical protein
MGDVPWHLEYVLQLHEAYKQNVDSESFSLPGFLTSERENRKITQSHQVSRRNRTLEVFSFLTDGDSLKNLAL